MGLSTTKTSMTRENSACLNKRYIFKWLSFRCQFSWGVISPGKNRKTLEGAEDSSHPDGGGEGKWGLDGNNDPRHGSFFDIGSMYGIFAYMYS